MLVFVWAASAFFTDYLSCEYVNFGCVPYTQTETTRTHTQHIRRKAALLLTPNQIIDSLTTIGIGSQGRLIVSIHVT